MDRKIMQFFIGIAAIMLLLSGCGTQNKVSSSPVESNYPPGINPAIDADMDGVNNTKDKCPKTGKGVWVDKNGCGYK
jgi:hypothetical protein